MPSSTQKYSVSAFAMMLATLQVGQLTAADAFRVATYNTSLYRDTDDQLIRDLDSGENDQARKIAEVIQRVSPDILFLNEFDYDEAGRAATLLREKYLAVGQNGCEPIKFDYFFTGPVNTGVSSGRDLDHNGKLDNPSDAIGFGRHPGQYGMLVLSKFPIDRDHIRSFQRFLWRDMPSAMVPVVPKTGKPFFNDEDLAVQRLSSKSFWDVPINVPAVGSGKPFTLHILGSHPTPPVFDGPEDRNGCRNHDEVRLIADYIDPKKSEYVIDDVGIKGGLAADASFVIVGDLNSDPVDGDSVPGTMKQLLDSPRVNASFTPTSEGGPLTVQKFSRQFVNHHGDPARVTGNFTGEGHGCLRIDYVLPSRDLEVEKGAIFWPQPGQPGSDAFTATDHHMVWVELKGAAVNSN